MKKINLITNFLIAIVLLAILFIVPTEKTTTVWITFAFTIFALFLNSCIAIKNKKSEVASLALVYTSFSYLSVQLIMFVVTLVFPQIKTWIILIFNILVLAIMILIVSMMLKSSNYISDIDEKNNAKRFFIKEIELELNLLISDEENVELKKKMLKLLERIRFSDPMSNEYVGTLECEIKTSLQNFSNSTEKNILIETLERKLKERNQKINLYK